MSLLRTVISTLLLVAASSSTPSTALPQGAFSASESLPLSRPVAFQISQDALLRCPAFTRSANEVGTTFMYPAAMSDADSTASCSDPANAFTLTPVAAAAGSTTGQLSYRNQVVQVKRVNGPVHELALATVTGDKSEAAPDFFELVKLKLTNAKGESVKTMALRHWESGLCVRGSTLDGYMSLVDCKDVGARSVLPPGKKGDINISNKRVTPV